MQESFDICDFIKFQQDECMKNYKNGIFSSYNISYDEKFIIDNKNNIKNKIKNKIIDFEYNINEYMKSIKSINIQCIYGIYNGINKDIIKNYYYKKYTDDILTSFFNNNSNAYIYGSYITYCFYGKYSSIKEINFLAGKYDKLNIEYINNIPENYKLLDMFEITGCNIKIYIYMYIKNEINIILNFYDTYEPIQNKHILSNILFIDKEQYNNGNNTNPLKYNKYTVYKYIDKKTIEYSITNKVIIPFYYDNNKNSQIQRISNFKFIKDVIEAIKEGWLLNDDIDLNINFNIYNDVCIICSENYSEDKDYISSKCKHTFHIKCIGKYVHYTGDNYDKCPLCRMKLEWG